MNSSVCVEQDEVSLDEFDSFVFSASNVSESSVDSDRSEKETLFFNNDHLHSSREVIDSSLSNNLVLCTTTDNFEKKPTNSQRRRNKKRQKSNNVKKSKKGVGTDEDTESTPLNINYLPLDSLLMNFTEGEELLAGTESDISFEDQLLFDSDEENPSFDGFSDKSNNSFEGFVSRANRIRSSSPILPNTSTTTKENTSNSKVFASGKATPNSSFSRILKGQNYSQGSSSSLRSSVASESEEEANAAPRTKYQESEKENLKFVHMEKNLMQQHVQSGPNLSKHVLEKDKFDLKSIGLSESEESDNEGFEGFDFRVDKSRTPFESDPNITKQSEVGIEKEKTANSDFIDKNDYIGKYCNHVGCSISWLETGMVKAKPVRITNGIVNELTEFAKSIAWEPHYVAIWILRLRGYKDMEVESDDMRKINSVIKRRKALSVTFAGYSNLKSKLASFDSELFILPTIEKLDKVKFSSNKENEKQLNRSIPNKNFFKLNNTKLEEEFNAKDDSNDEFLLSDDESINKDLINSDDEIFAGESENIDSLSNSEKNENLKKIDNDDCTNQSFLKSVKGRIRKPTTKAQESYLKQNYQINISSSDESLAVKSPNKDTSRSATENSRSKLLHPIFAEDIKDIGPYCKESGVDIKVLNSYKKADSKITKGVVYELYYFFRERKASLTSLVHTLYRLKDISIDKCNIIATMAEIHEMVKVMWDENINKHPSMPYEEFYLPEPTGNKEKKRKISHGEQIQGQMKKNLENQEPKNKKPKLDISKINESKVMLEDPKENEELSVEKDAQSVSRSNYDDPKVSGPMSNTFGHEGKITRGDIVYLYTKWLKKKMESQTNVFVTDLSNDVEDLILERKVEFIRIPVGTLMSSSVKLFEEFRKLSKSDMHEAKAYLLEDWIEDIKSILSTISKKNGNSNTSEDKEILRHKIPSGSSNNNKIKANECEGLNQSKENIRNIDLYSKKDEINNIKNDEPLIRNSDPNLEVEKIVGYRIVKIGEENVTEYRIRWQGHSSKRDSWINEADLNCPDILAEFWEALIKQRASRAQNDSSKNSKEKMPLNVPFTISGKRNVAKENYPTSSPPNKPFLETYTKSKGNKLNGQENISPFFGRDSSTSQKFFNLMVNSLKTNLVDYRYDHEEEEFAKRVKVTKKEVLDIYNKWRYENQEHLHAGGNTKVELNVLISRVKDLMEEKRVRNFNPSCLLDVCYRMSIMEAKLKDAEKVKEYLKGDFLELMQIGQKHQDFIRKENSSLLKKIKQDCRIMSFGNQKLTEKINSLDNLERELLIIAKFLNDHKTSQNLEKLLEKEIGAMKKFLEVKKDSDSVENLKKQNPNTVKELESFGVNEEMLNVLLNIALKIE